LTARMIFSKTEEEKSSEEKIVWQNEWQLHQQQKLCPSMVHQGQENLLIYRTMVISGKLRYEKLLILGNLCCCISNTEKMYTQRSHDQLTRLRASVS
jgi:hypothetical protein